MQTTEGPLQVTQASSLLCRPLYVFKYKEEKTLQSFRMKKRYWSTGFRQFEPLFFIKWFCVLDIEVMAPIVVSVSVHAM
jgi:hypothetical protein